MIKMIAVIISLLAILSLGGTVYAADSAGGLLGGNINLEGDTLYNLKTKSLMVGVGTTIASLKDGLVEIRGEAAATVITSGDSHPMLGIGIGVSINKLINKAGGNWALPLNAELGVVAMGNFEIGIKIEPAIYLSLIKVNF